MFPVFTNGWAWGTVSRQTANKKLAKLTITKASGGLTIVPIVPWHGGPLLPSKFSTACD